MRPSTRLIVAGKGMKTHDDARVAEMLVGSVQRFLRERGLNEHEHLQCIQNDMKVAFSDPNFEAAQAPATAGRSSVARSIGRNDET